MSKREVTEIDLRMAEFRDSRITPDMCEFDEKGNVVRKDRFEKAIQKIHLGLCELGLMHQFMDYTVDEVVEHVRQIMIEKKKGVNHE